MINLKLPDELRRRFKAWCSMRGTTMRDEMEKLIEEALAKKGAAR